MKIKKDRSHVIVEMGSKESGLPPAGVAELQLRHVLVPVDFSECSHKAFQYAISFARQFSADLMLLHVVVAVPPPPQMLVFEAETLRGKYHEEAAKHLSEWRKEAVSQISVKAVVREGMAAHQEIVAAAHECNSDLIVIGNHGRGGLARVLTGSTAERVVRHAPCPVLVVRGREHEFLVGAAKSREKSMSV
jgi:nucleotide-binding universal stress UspA family protein